MNWSPGCLELYQRISNVNKHVDIRTGPRVVWNYIKVLEM